MSEIELFRRRGVRVLAAGGVAWTALLLPIGWAAGSPGVGAAFGLGAIANLLPVRMAIAGRHDASARMVVGTLAAVMPALVVYLLGGHPWQMDAHMYFFVALAALTMLCDWRPIAVASALIALHHLALELLAPSWVFAGSGDLGRVLLHATAVVLQFAALAFVTVQLRLLTLRQQQARAESDRLAAEAVEARRAVEHALNRMRDAERLAAAERDRRERGEREAEEARRHAMHRLADAFQASVASIALGVDGASRDLDRSARALHGLARTATVSSEAAAATAERSSARAGHLAEQVGRLSAAVSAIAGSLDAQARLRGEARDASASGNRIVSALAERTVTIGSFASSIGRIAARTNLLALNATIEAAHAGEAGKGFAVVAGEVKSLAGQTRDASGEVHTLATSVSQGATEVGAALQAIDRTVARVSEAAAAITAEVRRHGDAAAQVEATARDTAAGADEIAAEVCAVSRVAEHTASLSEEVSTAASGLSATAGRLREATERFVDQLKAA